ncbi:MAG: lectin like domain-containing protein, partial [Candidatus Sumerlaeia bacterium]|nr:lectin like domain-containing protein [Candidatus Sumerlaeia bacterium]
MYQYDPLGWIDDYGGGSSTAWFANKFTATENHTLRSASWYTAVNNASYELWVYLNPNQGPINTDGYASYQQGTITYAGYNTIPLATPVPLTNGQTFSIVVKQTTPGYNYPIPVEYAYSGYSSNASSSP